jgi:hypothetical protein
MIPYRPLDKTRDEIRVLVLLPDETGDDEGINRLRCRLEHSPVSEASFSALSYVWGPQEENRGPLKVHYPSSGADLRGPPLGTVEGKDEADMYHTTIGSNLSWALIHIRKPNQEVRLWIDAVCINQADDIEKSWQVGLMARIYAHANGTLVWLGPNHRDDMQSLGKAAGVIEAAQQLGSHQIAADLLARYGWAKMGLWLSKGRNWLPHLTDPGEELEDGLELVMAFGHAVLRGLVQEQSLVPFYESLEALARRPWFTRAWVLQEYALANSVKWIIGQLQVDGDMLYIAVMLAWGFWDSCVLDDRDVNTMRLDLAQWLPPLDQRMAMYFLQLAVAQRNELPSLMMQLYLGNSGLQAEATDLRDKVFALLALVPDTMGLEPNYQFSTEHVYTLTASRFILSGHATFLSVPRSSSSLLRLPSWVTDWSAVPRYPARWLGFSAAGDTKPEPIFPLPLDLSQADFTFQADPNSPVLGVSLAPTIEEFAQRVLARRVGLRGLRLDSVAQLGPVADDHFNLEREDLDARREIEKIHDELTAFRASQPDTAVRSDTEIRFFSRFFHLLRSWLFDILGHLCEDDNEAWSATLDLVLHGGHTAMNEDGRHQLLRSRIWSAGDLFDPKNWFLDAAQCTKFLSDIVQLADGCRVFRAAGGSVGYAPVGAQTGDAVVILFGVPTPLVVRPVDSECFAIVGPAYMHSFMNGEAVQNQPTVSEMFRFQ